MANTTQIRQIQIRVDTKGNRELQDLAAKLGGINKNVKSLAGSFNLLKNAALGYAGVFSIGQLAGFSDELQQLRDRIKLFAGSSEEATNVLNELQARANRTKTTISALGDVYARLAATTQDAKIPTQALLDLTESLQDTFRISGSNAQEAANASVQFSQALALGVLRGQDLKSVLSQNAYYGGILAKSLGVTRGELLKLAESGAITAEKAVKPLLQNFQEITKKAEGLSQTFGQTLIVAMNKFQLAVFNVSDALGLSKGLAGAVEFLEKHLLTLGVIFVSLAASQIPTMITAVSKLSKALLALVVSNPLTALAAAAAIAIAFLVDELGGIKPASLKFLAFFQDLGDGILRIISGIAGLARSGPLKDLSNYLEGVRKTLKDSSAANKAKAAQIVLADSMENTKDKAYDLNQVLANFGKGSGGKEEKLKDILGDLNKLFISGKIDADEYYSRLDGFEIYKLNREFKEGKTNLDKYNLGLKEFDLKQVNREFATGNINLKEFNDQVGSIKQDELNIKLRAGIINLKEYNAELLKVNQNLDLGRSIAVGAEGYIESIGTVGVQVAKAVEGAFGHLEDNFTEFIKTGKFNFASFTQSILDDLTKIIVRATIIKPLAEGILGLNLFNSGTPANSAGQSYTDVSAIAAKGMAFEGGYKRFATGGVVSKPTMFNYGGGKTGLMGEAGTEAILPLARSSNGDLGVQASTSPVNITVVNNVGADVQTKESTGPNGERMVELLITQKVQEGISQGRFDKAMDMSYGLKRKGS